NKTIPSTTHKNIEQNNNTPLTYLTDIHEDVPAEIPAHTPPPVNTENNSNINSITKTVKSHKQRIKYKKEHTTENCLNPHCLTCAKDNIVNLSDTTLTKNQILLLNKGLSFVPTAKNAPAKEILNDFNIFTNKTKRKLKRLINPLRTPRPNDEPPLTRKNNKIVNNTNTQNLGPKPLEDAFLAMRNEIANITETQTVKHNLTRGERLALTQLSSNHNLVINKADKGSTIVVRSRDEYIKAGLEHLSDKNTYTPLDRDYTKDVAHAITHTLEDLCTRGLISPNMKEYCLPPKSPRTALIYFLAKIHKNPMGIRPIVSTVNSATANLAEFLDFYLQPIMKSLPAYLKDTGQFLQEISNFQVNKNTWLITVDVKSLYTNIPNEEGIQACYEAWRIQELTDPQHPPAETLRLLLELVLKLNTFEFNEKYYLQTFGTAMGSKLAPAYANTFMGKLEAAILSSSPTKPTYYRRFIDDIFMIWPHSEEELDKFIIHMNNQNKSIQFTYEKSLTEITFLDVIVSKQYDPADSASQIKLSTRTHIKNTNKQLYVKNESYHPPGTGKGIIIGEAIRYLRTNSSSNSFHKMIHKHKRNLTKRGYSKNKIDNILSNIKFTDKSKYNITRNKKRDNQISDAASKPTFVTRYCPNAQRAFRIVHKHWTAISTEIPILKRFTNTTPRLAYRANKNLSKKLVKAKLRQDTKDHPKHKQNITNNNHSPDPAHIISLANLQHHQQADSTSTRRPMITILNGHRFKFCQQNNCPIHSKYLHCKLIRSKISRRTFNTHDHNVSCSTPCVVYLIQCKKCGKQYVGQTMLSLKSRLSKHISSIKNPHQSGVLPEHFRKNKCSGIHNLQTQVLQSVQRDSNDTDQTIENKLKSVESLWMDRLKCEYPQGLNWAKYDPMKRYKLLTPSHHKQITN
ncbi:MAG: GIY-YIG nuclease family protein, partial [Rhodobacteraceae bacterium]|nr:GIY-YIG nuclease family protein [Paracoccaceae bacterium]